MDRQPLVDATNVTDYIIAYETEDMDETTFINLFQYLIDSGMAWTLQGHYGRTAKGLIEAGACHVWKEIGARP
jgi:hypothetical protein